MIDLGSMTDKFSEAGQKVARRAIELSKSRDHNFLGVVHLFMALVEVENALFVETMQVVGVDPNSVRRLLEEELAKIPVHAWRKMAIPEPTRNLFNRAMRRARAQGHQQIEPYDLFVTLFNDQNSEPAEILRRLGADPALVIMASNTFSQGFRKREKQAESLRNLAKSRDAQPFNFSRLTADFLDSIATIEETGETPELWETPDVNLTIQERQRVEAVVSSFLNKSFLRMNEATIWSRAIYPLLVLAEQAGLEAWSQAPLKARYTLFGLEGIADGVVGHNIPGVKKSFCLIVLEMKRERKLQDTKVQLYGAMLAAARLNWERNNQVPQEIFGCYILAENWTFIHGLVSDFEADRPKMTVASSRWYSEKIEAETILLILKSITGKYAQKLTDTA